MTLHESRDWPQTLKINAASIRLAHALHEARRESFCASWPEFSDLPPEARNGYITVAGAILKAAAPREGFTHDIAALLPTLARQQMRMVRP